MSNLQSASANNAAEQLISKALREKSMGKLTSYQVIVQELNNGTRLTGWYNMLAKNVTQVIPSDHELIAAIFNFNWFTRTKSAEFLAYSNFIVHLNCAHGGTYLQATYSAITKAFRGPLALSSAVSLKEDQHQFIDSHTIFQSLHQLIERLLNVLPCSLWYFRTAILDKFPHKVFETSMQVTYIQNVLRVSEYCPELRRDIIHLVVDRIVQIDVDIRRENSFIPSFSSEESGIMFQVEMLETTDDPDRQEELVIKIDQMLDTFLCWVSGTKQSDLVEDVFTIMLDAFNRVLMTSNEVKFAQWLIFYLCCLKPSFANQFLEHLFTNMEDGSLASSSRQRCVLYIASFVGRATYLGSMACQRALCIMVDWMKKYVMEHPSAPPDLEHHIFFYVVFQASCYMLCFAHESIFEDCGSEEMQALGLDAIMACSLNPMKICSPTLIQNFVKIVNRYGLNCDAIMEHNKKMVVLNICPVLGEKILLDVYPFDPYLLPESSKHFLSGYRFPEDKSDAGNVVLDDTESDSESHCNTLLGMGQNDEWTNHPECHRFGDPNLSTVLSSNSGSNTNTWKNTDMVGSLFFQGGGGRQNGQVKMLGSYEDEAIGNSSQFSSFDNGLQGICLEPIGKMGPCLAWNQSIASDPSLITNIDASGSRMFAFPS